MLYTGVSRIDYHAVDTVDVLVSDAVAEALEVTPNSAFLGSAYRMSALPIGLWVYNGLYTERDSTLRHWLWQHFKSDPTLVSQVNPQLRAQAAEAVLKDEGYFDATVTYDTLYHKHDSLRAKIGYDVTYRHQSRLGTIRWIPSPSARIDSILTHTKHLSYLKSGQRFSSTDLEDEKERITKTLNDSGYFFFSSDHVRYLADTTRQANTVDLRILVGVGANERALSPCTIDSVHYRLDYGVGLRSQNFDSLGFVTIGYNSDLLVQPKYLNRSLGFAPHALYSPDRISLAKTLISRLDVFKYTTTELQVLRAVGDSSQISVSDTHQETDSQLSTLESQLNPDTTSLRLNISAIYAMPWTGTTEIGTVYKDNHLIGPGATLTATRRNLWGGGEKLSFQLTGSYEWRTGKNAGDKMLNSYELGAKASITVPRLQLPHSFQPSREMPSSSTYSISLDWLRRGGLFEMIRASGSVEYGFSLDSRNTLSFAPLKLSYVSLIKTTSNYREIKQRYPSLEHAFEDQFIPQMQVSWTYDDAARSRSSNRHHAHYLNLTAAEAGGLTDVLMGQIGSHRKQGERQLFFQRFSQFLKATAEYRHLYRISNRLTLASRLQGGVGYAYGNSAEMPYSEKFYIGGPNSLRGFSVRGVGPGRTTAFSSQTAGTYAYLNRVGDIKLEGNVELRFPLVGSFHGALFVDAGNIWELESASHTGVPGSQFHALFLQQLAVDTGMGFRLDMGMLVLRFDIGVPLHDPNEDTSHYFNCRHAFFRNLGYNLAVGYPF